MIREISISFIELVGQVDWMDDRTKKKAKDKVLCYSLHLPIQY